MILNLKLLATPSIELDIDSSVFFLQTEVEILFQQLFKKIPKMDFLPAVQKSTSPENLVHKINNIALFLQIIPKLTTNMRIYRNLTKNKAIHYSETTSADIANSETIKIFTHKFFPNDLVISEEEKYHLVKEPQGVIFSDPIDGTRPFAEGGKNCCVVFTRFDINKNNTIDKGFSIIYEPFNKILTIGISGLGIFTFRAKGIPNRPNKNLFLASPHPEFDKALLKGLHKKLRFINLGSASIGMNRMLFNYGDLYIWKKVLLWDLLPGALNLHIIGKQVFNFVKNENIFPLKVADLIDICEKSKGKNDLELTNTAVTNSRRARQAVVKLFN
jgi:fructose-1,6-bisphosphatase/inositol monophosphatase family enzyme